MKRLILAVIACTPLINAEDPSIYLNGRLLVGNGRYNSFTEALRLMSERNVKTIVETGTARCGDTNFDGDGGSTILFAHWAQNHGAHFYSVDISPTFIDVAKKASTAYHKNMTFALSDSAVFLQNFDKTIDFLYLDSWDYSETDPMPAQIHCLNEIKGAYDKLSPNSIVMIDDCNIPGGGKGKLAIQWLLERGWRLHLNRHHVILLKN